MQNTCRQLNICNYTFRREDSIEVKKVCIIGKQVKDETQE